MGKNCFVRTLIFTLLFSGVVLAQGVAINNDGFAAHASAALDVSSTTQGFLVPRMTEAERESITSPATALVVYQTDEQNGFKYYTGTEWYGVGSSGAEAANTSVNSDPGGVAINTTGAAADVSAILDVSSTTQGLLLPRMTKVEREAIASPAEGLLVFQTDETMGFYFISGNDWQKIVSVSGNVPEVPTLSSPADDAVGQSKSPTLSWHAVNGAVSYKVQVSENNTFVDLRQYAITGASKSISDLSAHKQYYWRVCAVNSTGSSSFSDVWSFKTKVEWGDNYAGGEVIYVDATGNHGFVKVELNISAPWDDGSSATTSAIAKAIGTGVENTQKIIAVHGAGNYAAKICNDLVHNGYDDWFLPSLDLLTYCSINLPSGYVATHYWSSTERDDETAITMKRGQYWQTDPRVVPDMGYWAVFWNESYSEKTTNGIIIAVRAF